jgi:hypothetical protein
MVVAGAGALRLDRVSDAIWAEPVQWSGSSTLNAPRASFARSRTMQLVVGEHTHHRTPAQAGLPAIEHFIIHDRESMAITNGLSAGPQPGATPQDENERVELYLQSKDIGPWADFWLHWGAASLFNHGPEHPIRPYDRLVLDAPREGIAGAIVWPAGHLNPFGDHEPTVILWDMLPFLPEELAHFRADPSAHGRWLDEREEKNDFSTIHDRWRG